MSTCSFAYKPPRLPITGPARSILGGMTDDVSGDCDGQTDMLLQALDAVHDGLILTDAASRVLYTNRAARGILAHGSLTIKNKLLCTPVASETRSLQSLVAARARGSMSDAYFRTSGPSPQSGVVLMVTAPDGLAAERLGQGPTVVVMARQLSQVSCPSPVMIGSLFGLTPAEARLAYEMTKGDGLKPCADRLGITTSTARTHLKHVFDKTGTKRQAELVRLLFSCGFPAVERTTMPATLVASSIRRLEPLRESV